MKYRAGDIVRCFAGLEEKTRVRGEIVAISSIMHILTVRLLEDAGTYKTGETVKVHETSVEFVERPRDPKEYQEPLPASLKAVPCPCGCNKWIVQPLFGCQCSSLTRNVAEELVARWNYIGRR